MRRAGGRGRSVTFTARRTFGRSFVQALLVRRGEYQEVGKKPLGDGFVSVPVREFCGSLIRPIKSRGIDIGFLVVSGLGGQTVEALALPGDRSPFERIVRFPLKSYVTASFTYRFRQKL